MDNNNLEEDKQFQEMISSCSLFDLHSGDPAQSTYIGSAGRRIDFMFGCESVATAVTRQGSLSYHEGPQSDHRGLYVDIDAKALLKYLATDNKIQPPRIRTLKTGNPETVAIYHKIMLEYYDQHKMAKRISKLHANHHLMPDSAVKHKLEKWDQDQGRAMQAAEKKIKATRLKNTIGPLSFGTLAFSADIGISVFIRSRGTRMSRLLLHASWK
jgi:hypothetical protein